MRLLMVVEDVFTTGAGDVVVSGTCPGLDRMPRREIARIVGTRVRVHPPGALSEDFAVTGLDIAHSVTGALNIALSLGNAMAAHRLRPGDEVFAGTELHDG